MFLAVIAGGVVFVVSLMMLTSSGIGGPRAHPLIIAFVGWAGAGALAALAAAWVAPRRAWAFVPLLVLMEAGAVLFAAGVGASLNSRLTQGTFTGALAGIIVGSALIALCCQAGSARRRARLTVIAAAGLVGGEALSVLFGSPGISRVRRDVYPAVDDLLRSDVLAKAGPMSWRPPGWTVGLGGRPFVQGHGVMTDPHVGIYFVYGSPHRVSGNPGQAEGLNVHGLNISLYPAASRLTIWERSRPEVMRSNLLSLGLQPELVSRLRASPRSELEAHYRGVACRAAWRTSASLDSVITLECSGTRSQAAP